MFRTDRSRPTGGVLLEAAAERQDDVGLFRKHGGRKRSVLCAGKAANADREFVIFGKGALAVQGRRDRQGQFFRQRNKFGRGVGKQHAGAGIDIRMR